MFHGIADSLLQLLSGPVACSVPGCSWQLLGAQQLAHHVANFHRIPPTNANYRHQLLSTGLTTNHACHNLNQLDPPASNGDDSHCLVDQNLNWRQEPQPLGGTHFQEPALGSAAVAKAASCPQLEEDIVKEEIEPLDKTKLGDMKGFFNFATVTTECSNGALRYLKKRSAYCKHFGNFHSNIYICAK